MPPNKEMEAVGTMAGSLGPGGYTHSIVIQFRQIFVLFFSYSIQKAMEKCVEEAVSQTIVPLTLSVEGMGNFRGAVVFAKVAPGSALDRLCTLAGI